MQLSEQIFLNIRITIENVIDDKNIVVIVHVTLQICCITDLYIGRLIYSRVSFSDFSVILNIFCGLSIRYICYFNVHKYISLVYNTLNMQN